MSKALATFQRTADLLDQLWPSEVEGWGGINTLCSALKWNIDKLQMIIRADDISRPEQFEEARRQAAILLYDVMVLNLHLGNDLEQTITEIAEDRVQIIDHTREDAEATITQHMAEFGPTLPVSVNERVTEVEVSRDLFHITEVQLEGYEGSFFQVSIRKTPEHKAKQLMSSKWGGTPRLQHAADEYVVKNLVTRMELLETNPIILTALKKASLRYRSLEGDETQKNALEKESIKVERVINNVLSAHDCMLVDEVQTKVLIYKYADTLKDMPPGEAERQYLALLGERMLQGTMESVAATARAKGVQLVNHTTEQPAEDEEEDD